MSVTQPQPVHVERSAGVATITIDDPATRNALSGPVLDALATACAEVEGDPDVRVVVVRGGGDRVFVSGGNIAEVNRAVGGDHNSPGAAAMLALASVTKPVVAAINGHCLGGGLLVALSADIRICVDQATFGIPAVRLGVAYPQVGVDMVVREVGASQARHLLITGERITAERAAEIGLVHTVTSADGLAATVDELTTRLLTNAPLSMAAGKASVSAATGGLERAEATKAIAAAWTSTDAVEGTAAFLEKRPPEFTGQ